MGEQSSGALIMNVLITIVLITKSLIMIFVGKICHRPENITDVSGQVKVKKEENSKAEHTGSKNRRGGGQP